MRIKVYQKLRTLGMSFARVAEITGHDPGVVRDSFRKVPPREKATKQDGTIREKENASAPQGESRTQ